MSTIYCLTHDCLFYLTNLPKLHTFVDMFVYFCSVRYDSTIPLQVGLMTITNLSARAMVSKGRYGTNNGLLFRQLQTVMTAMLVLTQTLRSQMSLVGKLGGTKAFPLVSIKTDMCSLGCSTRNIVLNQIINEAIFFLKNV